MPPTLTGRRRAVAALLATPLLGAAGLGVARPARAEARFPTKPIRIIVPFPPGQTNDVFARLLADKASELRWRDTRVIVDNRPGGGGTIGMQAAARSVPDGYTLAFGSLATLAINPALMRHLPYDVERDFVPVLRVFEGSLLLVVPPSGPPDAQTLLQRARAGGLTYASSGPGSTQHMATELFLQRAGARATHVPYRGSGQAMTDLMGGMVDFAVEAVAVALPLVQAGRLKALAVTSAGREPRLPAVPTVAEAAEMPGYVAAGSGGLLAPAGTPPAVVETLHEGFGAALADPAVRQRFADLACVPVAESAAAFGAFIRAERAKWQEVARRGDISLDP